ncbi:MAG: hypothetical protein ABIK92_16700 [Pseudomonadota bacterium]
MRSLKTALWICASGCLAAIPFVVLPWEIIQDLFVWFGIEPIPDTPLLIYFFRGACGIIGLIGIYFIILARNPVKYGPMLNLGAYGLMVFGLLSLILGLSLEMSLKIYLGDAIFGIALGLIVAILSRRAQEISKV